MNLTEIAREEGIKYAEVAFSMQQAKETFLYSPLNPLSSSYTPQPPHEESEGDMPEAGDVTGVNAFIEYATILGMTLEEITGIVKDAEEDTEHI